ncbi:EAL domain-containing protein [Acidicapsa dinghuensis]|uniref:cyclic-guanylate-specific phosphodiesterase n=1 Tax=Acidicapsa dinghuensis TaxID=2218256 RepID=A0ABW1EEL5_9BACT|nr:EAL domain-containing protein [Acidicapsa dinghuensis]
MRMTANHRIPIAIRSLAVLCACTVTGLVVGGLVAYQSTELKLDHYGRQLIAYAEAYNSEIITTLDEVNASPHPFCSDQDINRLRELVYHGHIVKEIGRVRNNMLYCTSVNGRLDHPIQETPADLVTPSGKSIWLNKSLYSVPGMRGDITQYGEADFIAAQNAFGDLREDPMGYTTTLANHVTGKVLPTAGDPLKLTNQEVLAERELLRGDTFYVARCSERFAPCMVTSITLHKAWLMNSSLIGGFALIGVLAGVVFASMNLLHWNDRSLQAQLRRALRYNQITVVYQPIVEIKTGKIVGAEALARWIDEDGNYVRPDVFVSAAEELGIIGKLTRVVLDCVVTELGEHLRSHPQFYISVNIAAADLADPQFLPALENVLRTHDIATRSINLELTERSTADHHMAISAIHKLRERGHQFFIDDFGTGYSSLSYLNQLAVDAIKIDRAFTDAIGTGSLTAAIVPQILSMAATLGVTVVVEGVERAEQSAYFAALQQHILAQGWHFGEAIPAKDLMRLFESREAEKLLA